METDGAPQASAMKCLILPDMAGRANFARASVPEAEVPGSTRLLIGR
jgi:hypothetical protein